ncbi:MAG: hypothetical protein IT359_08365 [Gemmatimonadaceae bacterium]|nr:hypothetical protein [Gemmatimonadaceae bacterium]
MRRRRATLFAVAALGAVLGGIFLVLPPAVGNDAAPPLLAGDSTPALPTLAPGNPALAEDVVIANVFSPRRSPPTSRYSPPDAAMDSSGGVVADTAAMGVPPQGATGEPQLLGTVVGARGTQALLQLDPLGGSARLYSVGDREGGYRVISIAPGSVVLAGPQGRLTLRLVSPEDRP